MIIIVFKVFGLIVVGGIALVLIVGVGELAWDAIPANRVAIQILNDTSSAVTLQNLPCDDFCAEYEVVAKLKPGEQFTRGMVPFSNLAPYRVYSVNDTLVGCIDLKYYFNLSPRQTLARVSDATTCDAKQ